MNGNRWDRTQAPAPSDGVRGDTRELFDVPEEVVYLNCANMAPRLRSVSAAGLAALERLARPWTVRAADWFAAPERLRELFATLVNASPDSVALIPSASYGIAVAARNVRVEAGSSVVVLEQQYPSNIYAWQRVCAEKNASLRTVPRSETRSPTEALLGAIDERTAVVAVPNCHWTDGALLDLEQVGPAARQVGAALVVDASQSLGAYPLDVEKVRPDFLVSVGYKWLLGPYGLAYLYADEAWHSNGVPIEESWLTRAGSEDFASLVDYVDEYRPGARRFDGGEFPRFLSVPMACAALSQLVEWEVGRVHATLTRVTDSIQRRAESLGLSASQPFERVGHMVGLGFPNSLPKGLAGELRRRRVHVSIRGDKLRVAPHLHTTADDVERFIAALAACV